MDTFTSPGPVPRIEPTVQRHGFEFRGDWREFFKIWIVNVALSVLTLGIYSAWAKVRTRRYFYGHTFVAGSSFDYLADPLAILKGRIIAVLLIVIYLAVAGEGAPILPLIISIMQGDISTIVIVTLTVQVALVVILPWLFVQGLTFRARVTRYRNVPFNYEDSYRKAMWPLVLFPGVVIFLFFLLWPWADAVRRNHILNRYRFGAAKMKAQISVAQLFRIYVVAFLLLAGLGVLAFVGSIIAGAGIAQTLPLIPFLIITALLVLAVWNQGYIQARIINHMFETLAVDDYVRFESRIDPVQYGIIAATNWLAMIFSLGLAWPWTRVRLAKYRAENLTAIADRPVEEIAGEVAADLPAMGEEMIELGGFDIGF